MRLSRLTLALSVLLVLLIGAGCPQRRTRALRLAVPASVPGAWQPAVEQWAQLTDERTRSRLIVQQTKDRGDAGARLESVRSGTTADCALIPASALAEADAAFDIFALPWLFPDADTASRVCEGPMGDAMLERLDALGLVGLAYGSSGFRQLATRSKAVRAPADLRDMTVSLPAGRAYAPHADALEAIGAGPRRGSADRADAWEWSMEDPPAAGAEHAPRAVTLWNAAYEPFLIVVNKRTWDDLPELDRGLLRMSAQDAVETQRRQAAEGEDRLARDLEREGVTVVRLRQAERATFEQAAAPAIERWTETIGPDLVREFRAEVDRAR